MFEISEAAVDTVAFSELTTVLVEVIDSDVTPLGSDVTIVVELLDWLVEHLSLLLR